MLLEMHSVDVLLSDRTALSVVNGVKYLPDFFACTGRAGTRVHGTAEARTRGAMFTWTEKTRPR